MNKTVSFLMKQQKTDGSFDTFSSSTKDFKEYSKTHTTFINSLILDLLCRVEESGEELQSITEKLSTYIMNQKSKHWTWNYWDRQSHEYQKNPYPDDADDTFAALNALYAYNPELISGEALAHIVTGLTSIEKDEGGPYKTWYTKSKKRAWNDVDIAVNIRIWRFLKSQNVELPNLAKYIFLSMDNLYSPYYPSRIPILYELSQCYTEELDKKITEYCSLETDHSQFEKALKMLILKKYENREQTGTVGSYRSPSPICYDPMIKGVKYFAGSPAITAAACLATLSVEINPRIYKKPLQNDLNHMQEILLDDVKKECLALPSPISEALQEVIDIMGKKARKDTQILLLPYLFSQNFTGGEVEDINEKIMKSLSKAHFYGWCAYSMYDDILDEDKDYKALNIANTLLQRCLHCFYEATPPQFHKIVRDTLCLIDNSMYWEKHNAWIPIAKDLKYEDHRIAQKSYGHMLAPLAILFIKGYSESSKEYIATENFFKHYILARQLGDDAHDWENDLKSGFVNSVALPLFKRSQLKKPLRDSDIQHAREVFWDSHVLFICNQIENHCIEAEKTLSNMTFLQSKEIFQRLIDDKKSMVQETRHQQNMAREFIHTYKG